MPSPACPSCAVPRPAAVVNREIRALAARVGLTDGARRELVALWAEWRAAVQAEEAA